MHRLIPMLHKFRSNSNKLPAEPYWPQDSFSAADHYACKMPHWNQQDSLCECMLSLASNSCRRLFLIHVLHVLKTYWSHLENPFILRGFRRHVMFCSVFDKQLSDLAIFTSHLKPFKLSVTFW